MHTSDYNAPVRNSKPDKSGVVTKSLGVRMSAPLSEALGGAHYSAKIQNNPDLYLSPPKAWSSVSRTWPGDQNTCTYVSSMI